MLKPLAMLIITSCEKFLKIGIGHHLTCLLRNLYAGQEATVRTGHGTTDWLQMGKEYVKILYCHPAYLIHTQSKLIQNVELSEAQAGKRLQGKISITSNNAYDTTLMTESKVELKSLFMKMKEESENTCFKLAFKKLRSWHLVPSLHSK